MTHLQHGVKEREREFHDRRFGSTVDPRAGLSKYYDTAQESKDYYYELIRLTVGPDARVLEYGTGTGARDIENYKALPCTFYGIDISLEAIKKAHATALSCGFHAQYSVQDAEHTTFDSGFFDLVVGSGILHHLNLESAMSELARITNKNGSCIFFEPLGHNPLITAYRAFTPRLRSKDEHPLLASDFKIMERHFARIEIAYFNCFSMIAVIFRKRRFFNQLRKILSGLDGFLVKHFNWFGKYCWICVIRLGEPKGEQHER